MRNSRYNKNAFLFRNWNIEERMEGYTLQRQWSDYLWCMFSCFGSFIFSTFSTVNKYCYLIKDYWEKREEGGLTRRFCLVDPGCLVYVRNWRLKLSFSGARGCATVVTAILCCRRNCTRRCTKIFHVRYIIYPSQQPFRASVTTSSFTDEECKSNLSKNRWLVW